jgi:DNA-binding response OmpR family regulator
MSRVLVITDNQNLVEDLKRHVGRPAGRGTAEGLRLLCASPRADLVEFVTASGVPDVVFADLDGAQNVRESLAQVQEALQTLRARETPIIARLGASMLDRLDFGLGLADFVESSATVTEIIARIRLLLWRLNKVDVKDVVKVDDLVIDLANYEVSVRGRSVTLTFKEYELLRFLATHPGKVFTRDRLLNHVWGYDYYGGSRTVDVHIRRLRSKLRTCRKEHIETLRNVGYKFVP